MLLAATLRAWYRKPAPYWPLARNCAIAAIGCLAVGAARPAPLALSLALILPLGIPWRLAVVHRLGDATDRPAE